MVTLRNALELLSQSTKTDYKSAHFSMTKLNKVQANFNPHFRSQKCGRKKICVSLKKAGEVIECQII